MSLVAQAETAVVVLASAAAVVSLWRGAERHAGPVKHAYWWFTLAAACWVTGVIVQQVLATPVLGTPLPLSAADLPGLLALGAMVAGLACLPSRRVEPAREPLAERGRGGPGAATAHLADGYVLASALFVIGWIALFGSGYLRSGDGPEAFALELIHPLADLVVLGGVLPLAVAAGRRGVLPYLALLALTVSDGLAVGARVSGGHPGTVGQVLQVIGFGLLGCAPWADSGRRAQRGGAARLSRAGLDATTIVASLAAAVAGLVVIGSALAGGPAAGPVVALAGGTAVLALAARILSLVRQDSVAARLWRESGRQFRELADRTSDVVLVCDFDGSIRYASPAVADYGYTPADVEGRWLAELLHPEDRSGGTRAVRAVVGSATRPAGRYPCRVRAADGTWRHVESTVSRYRSPDAPDQLLITARDVSDQVELRRQVTHLTYHDGLTGLPNRAYLEDRARGALSLGRLRDAQAAPDGPGVAGVILVDLDGFTGVNDAAGHSAGDLVLAQVARRLRTAVPPQDTVARWGGDEFGVLVEGAASAQEIVDMAERLASQVAAEPFRAADRDVSLTASVGVALADGSPAGYVWRNADAAVSRAKDSGGGRVEIFAAHRHTDVARRLELAGELNSAIIEGQLELAYQPIAELTTLRITGVEALARWQRGGAAVPPGEFLEVAEASGVIMALGDWMLRASCAQAAAWRLAGWPTSVCVHCSPRQVASPQFAESVLGALSASGLPTGALTLEVAERVLVDGGGVVLRTLGQLRERGVRLAIDAFGTDFASLAHLRQLPVDVIKIGSSLVAGLGTDATAATLVRAMLRIGGDLGVEVVAEGIERPEQLDLLREMGCTLGQGALVAGPMTAADVETLAKGRGPAGSNDPLPDTVSPAETNAFSG